MSDDSSERLIETRFHLEELLEKGELEGAVLRGFMAEGFALSSAELYGVRMSEVGLPGCDASHSRLESSMLRQLDGRRGNWNGALWRDTEVRDSDLTEIDFAGAELWSCQFRQSRMSRASFQGARLHRCDFDGTELYGVDFTNAVISACTFRGLGEGIESMTRASFAGATLIDVDLSGVNLYGADFRGALLARCSLAGSSCAEGLFTGASLVRCNALGVACEGAVL